MAKRATDPGNPTRRVGDEDDVRGNPDWSPWVLLLIIPVVDRGGTVSAMAAQRDIAVRALITAPDLGFPYEGA